MENTNANESLVGRIWKKFRASSYVELLGIVCLIVTFCIIVQAQNNVFLSTLNIRNVLKQMVVYALLSCALAFPMINGTFDLSNGAMAGIGGVICGRFITAGLFGVHLPLGWAIVGAIVICSLFGYVNGIIVAYTSIPSFIVTIGADTALRGLIYIFSDNTSVNGFLLILPVSVTSLFLVSQYLQ
jgi:ribose/xylose/arabinose/galactoside ABC-type transport system permease subunit